MKITKRFVEHITIQYNVDEQDEALSYCTERIREGYKIAEHYYNLADDHYTYTSEAIMELEK